MNERAITSGGVEPVEDDHFQDSATADCVDFDLATVTKKMRIAVYNKGKINRRRKSFFGIVKFSPCLFLYPKG